ncbi:MAG TPA: hypothetical protein VM681_10740 [Candidatus Thermoplasmatota archaeon]|nr:hypothetical protein [Candidatus Thermoplasmatota archaeon]
MTELDAWLAAEGARMRPFEGQPGPERFGSPWAEHEALTARVAILDARRHARWLLAGPDRERLLHGVLSNEIRGMKPGEARESLLLDPKGRLVARLALLETDAAYLVLAEAGCAAAAKTTLERYLRFSKSRMGEADLDEIRLVGPLAPRLFEQVTDGEAPKDGTFVQAGNAYARAFAFGELPGVQFLVQRDETLEMWKLLRQAGAQPAGFAAEETARVWAGEPRFGAELSPDVFPQEVGLDPLVSFAKGCFVGQETMARIKNLGKVNRRLVRVRFDAKEPPAPGATLSRDGKDVGTVTSSVKPGHESPVGLALVRVEAAEPGMRLSASGVAATVL